MSDDRIRKLSEAVVREWKMKLDVTRLPVDIHVSLEDELVSLIEDAIRTESKKGKE